MSFLQPMLLAALPLVALPIIIHLINQRRYQTVRWAAMMFLLAANRMSRGYARIRQWLIMAMRMAAIAALIFAISRPLAGGWLGLAGGGRADTTIVLVDRSPSMQQTGTSGGGSKLQTGLAQLSRTLTTLGSARWVVIDGTTNRPRELDSIDELPRVPSTGPSSASADIAGMLQAARDYIKANKVGRTEVWICSDDRANDWAPDSGRWQALRDEFQQFPQGVRFHLLAYAQPASRNLSVRVTGVRRQKTGDAAELLISLKLARQDGGEGRDTVPVQFEIDGARSEVAVDLAGAEAELKDHRIPLEKGKERGWGRVSIPADSNPADNDFYFVFEPPVARKAIVVAEDAAAARPLELAASISPEPGVPCAAEVLAPGQLGGVDWDQVALLLWQAPLPDKDAAGPIRTYVERGGSAIFFPPRCRTLARSTGSAGRPGRSPRARTPSRAAGAAMRTCWPTRRAARRCRSASSRSARLRALRQHADGAGHAQGRRAALGPGRDRRRRRLFLRHDARRRRLIAGDRRRGSLRHGAAGDGHRRRLPGHHTAAHGRRADPRRPRPLGADRRRRGSDLDRIRRAPGRLRLRRSPARRESVGARGIRRPAGRPPRR